ncbi:MAG: hydrogenase 2 operon protein HybA [Desulfobacterales bacterium]|jgi:Fe-S-cluster-containing dehydrogenase component
MKIKRRDFLKGLAGSAVLAMAPPAIAASSEKNRLPDALGILYDATLCVGCQACMVACKKANNMPMEFSGSQRQWDNPVDLSSKTLNIIKEYENGTAKVKDREIDGYAFIKRQCMHCVDPACVSACPATAMTKDPKTGIVSYNKDACIGCRYCAVACPFDIPKFEWDNPFPKIVKCQLCNHLVAKGQIAACASGCPTGASIFGPVKDLLIEAERRQTMIPGKYYEFPVAEVSSTKKEVHKVKQYIPYIYGKNDGGGTQTFMMAAVPFNKLGLPTLPDRSYAAMAENIQHTLYKGMILPIVVFGGLIFLVKRSEKNKKE